MKIALLGYGKMGKVIERIALERKHEIILKIDINTPNYDITKADVAIDFSAPNSAFNNVVNCFKNNVPVICGTTGWLDKYFEATQICKKNNGAFICASNFSLGVNLFFQLNKMLAKMMTGFDNYAIDLEETHHTEKLDTPSGTAITLAKSIIKRSEKTDWKLGESTDKNIIPIIAKREPNVPGTHIVSYSDDIDTIEIKHTAHSRDGFALGAVIAAEWIIGKNGIFSMRDVLNIKT